MSHGLPNKGSISEVSAFESSNTVRYNAKSISDEFYEC